MRGMKCRRGMSGGATRLRIESYPRYACPHYPTPPPRLLRRTPGAQAGGAGRGPTKLSARTVIALRRGWLGPGLRRSDQKVWDLVHCHRNPEFREAANGGSQLHACSFALPLGRVRHQGIVTNATAERQIVGLAVTVQSVASGRCEAPSALRVALRP